MEPRQLVDRVNQLPYPPTIYSHGWIYGLWYCGTSFQKAIYYGQYPPTFVRRVKKMFEGANILHLCCGRSHIEGAINVDLHFLPEVDVRANAEKLPFKNNHFDMVLLDPPYSQQDSDRYKAGRLLSAKRVLSEAGRVLNERGWLLWLDEKYPSYRRDTWTLEGLIGICTGFERRTRILSMFRKTSQTLLFA